MSDTAYPVYQHYGTAAQRAAFTPVPPATGQPIYTWYETDTDNFYIYTTAWKGPYRTLSAVNSSANVVTSESTSSTSYADLSTTGPAVTLTLTGTTATVLLSSQIQRNGTGSTGLISVAVSGASTVAASDNASASGVSAIANTSVNIAAIVRLTGLTAGSNTFTAKYRVDANSYNFFNRGIVVLL